MQVDCDERKDCMDQVPLSSMLSPNLGVLECLLATVTGATDFGGQYWKAFPQALQRTVPSAAEYRPAGHAAHVGMPTFGEAYPAWQSVHFVEVDSEANWPAGQSKQAVP